MPYVTSYFYCIASLLLTGYFLVIAKSVISPFLAALITALALNPLLKGLEKRKVPRLLGTIVIIFFFVFIILTFIFLFSLQVATVDFKLDNWKTKFNSIFAQVQNSISDYFGVSGEQQTAFFNDSFTTVINNSTSLIKNTLSLTTNFISSLVLFIICLFFLLYYHRFLASFLYRVVNSAHHPKLKNILVKTQSVVQHYIFGLSLIILSVAVLNTTGLFILGIDNALLFGVLAAVLTIVPYIGVVIGSLLPVFFAFSTKNSLWYPGGVLLLFMSVQFIEGNFLTPNIVGKQVSINPLAATLGLFIGGMLLGLIGIIVALPILAIIKLICDEIDYLNPLGYLLGNPEEKVHVIKLLKK